jgi:CdiI immunity protein
MSALRDKLPHLDHFLNAYMHQDWQIFGNTIEAVIAAYAEDTSAEEVYALRDEIAMLLEAEGDRIEPAYHSLYPNSVLPSGWGMTAQQWLRRVAELAAAYGYSTNPPAPPHSRP